MSRALQLLRSQSFVVFSVVLIANELVAVQPMSLPSGLIFFLDFETVSAKLGYDAYRGDGSSLYGGGVIGQQITGGVDLSGVGQYASMGFYDLNNGYSSPTGSATITVTVIGSGTFGGNWSTNKSTDERDASAGTVSLESYCQYDPDLVSGSTNVAVGTFPISEIKPSGGEWDADDFIALKVSGGGGNALRRLQRFDPVSGSSLGVLVILASGSQTVADVGTGVANWTTAEFPIKDTFSGSAATQAGTANAIGAGCRSGSVGS